MIYDKTEVYTDCTVQILHDTNTGECSIGWTQDMDMAEEMIRQAHEVNGK